MAPTRSDDGEMQVLRTRRSPDRAVSTSAEHALDVPLTVAGNLPFPPPMREELVRRAAAVGLDSAAVEETWLRPMPERLESGTQKWPPEYMEIFRSVKHDYDSSESPDQRAARIATTLEGALVTNDDTALTAYFRMPKQTTGIEYPLLMLNEATWLIDVLDAQRRALVAECRAQRRSWADIALALGVTRASAWERYSSSDE